MKTLDEVILSKLLFVGNEIPDFIVKDTRGKFILLGLPAELMAELMLVINGRRQDNTNPYKCPVCDGRGTISLRWVDSTCNSYPCKACEGTGILWK